MNHPSFLDPSGISDDPNPLLIRALRPLAAPSRRFVAPVEAKDAEVVLANQVYEAEKAAHRLSNTAGRITVPMIERRFGLRPGALANYRARFERPTRRGV